MIAVAILCLCGLVIAFARPRLFTAEARVKERSDAYALPPSRVLPAVSMGYRDALADMIWAHVLVTQGLRFGEKRAFDHLDLYLDAIATLAPKFREPYKLADSLLSFQTNDPNKTENVRKARAFVERGLREFPMDAELWMNFGEFLAYVAPSALSDENEIEAWREAGAAALMRAGELGGRDEYLLWHAVSAAGLLADKEAERGALIRFLERIYASTEDVELREHVKRKLTALAVDQSRSDMIRRQHAFDERWRPLGFVTRTQLRVIGPTPSAWACAGQQTGELARARCGRDWSSWARTLRPEP